MDVYNRGQWDFDADAQLVVQTMGFFGGVKVEGLYDENPTFLFGRADGAFIALRASLLDGQGMNIAVYPYVVSFNLQTYSFDFMVPDFVSILIFCKEFHQIITEQNAALYP